MKTVERTGALRAAMAAPARAAVVAALWTLAGGAGADPLPMASGEAPTDSAGLTLAESRCTLYLHWTRLRGPALVVVDDNGASPPEPLPELNRPAATATAPPPSRSRYADEVEAVAAEYAVDGDLIHAVIAIESNYARNAVSARGAVGLMQLMPATARKYGIANAADALQNIRGGAQHLRHLLSVFDGNVDLALAAYNAGETAVRRHGRKVPPFRETIEFVKTVQAVYRGRKQSALP